MLFRKKKDINIEEAINFIKNQKKLNNEDILIFREQGFSTSVLEDWNRIYDNILQVLKSTNKNS